MNDEWNEQKMLGQRQRQQQNEEEEEEGKNTSKTKHHHLLTIHIVTGVRSFLVDDKLLRIAAFVTAVVVVVVLVCNVHMNEQLARKSDYQERIIAIFHMDNIEILRSVAITFIHAIHTQRHTYTQHDHNPNSHAKPAREQFSSFFFLLSTSSRFMR